MKENQFRVIELPTSVKNKIAAGEVIEGPFSCVKELIENSLDAQAYQITIDIEDGGKKLINVSDNGLGIHPDDISLVTKRYSTSKLENIDDLNFIKTLGFRGEALSSVSSVSHMEILSKFDNNEMGRYIKLENGKIIEEKPKQRQRGTSVIVKYLFNNYPARRKFLRSANAEFRKILGEVIPKCIAFPEISFLLTHNNKEVINVKSGSREERLILILDESFLNSLIPIKYETDDGLNLEGWIQKPNLPSQKKYYLFVNRRNVWYGKVFRILRDFYTPFSNENPSFILFIDIPYEMVDVNVHPTKREVRFHKENRLLSHIHKALEETIGEDSSYRKELFSFEIEEIFQGDTYEKFWQLHKSYIVAQTKNGLVIIDQHAAHERIIFDSLKNNKLFPTQTLLFPIHIKHAPLEMLKLKEIDEELKTLGFRFHIFSGNTVIWEGIPAILDDISEEGIIGILQDLTEDRETSIDKIIKAISCNLAIEAGVHLSPQEMEHLVNQLFSTEKPFRCPHGRPTIYEIPLNELEKKFER